MSNEKVVIYRFKKTWLKWEDRDMCRHYGLLLFHVELWLLCESVRYWWHSVVKNWWWYIPITLIIRKIRCRRTILLPRDNFLTQFQPSQLTLPPNHQQSQNLRRIKRLREMEGRLERERSGYEKKKDISRAVKAVEWVFCHSVTLLCLVKFITAFYCCCCISCWMFFSFFFLL